MHFGLLRILSSGFYLLTSKTVKLSLLVHFLKLFLTLLGPCNKTPHIATTQYQDISSFEQTGPDFSEFPKM